MIFEERYKILLSACQDIRRHRERHAKPVMADQLLAEVGMDVPSESLLSHMIAEALLLRVDRNLLVGKNIYLQQYEVSQIDLFGLLPRAIPHVPQSYAIANQYLGHALRPLASAAIVDIGIGKGLQIVDLLRSLALDPGRLRRLRIVALDPSAANIAEAAAAIAVLAPDLPFTVDVLGLRALVEQCDATMLRAAAGDVEGTVINAAYALHHTRHPPHETEARTDLLRRLAVLQPRVFTLVEPSANHDTDQLTRRVHSCWEHFGTVFDLIDHSAATPLEKFAIKEKFFGREVRDILGSSDAFRCERHEPYESWLLRLAKAGLRPFPGGDLTVALPDYCSAIVREGLVRLCYRGVPLIAVFAYRSPEGVH